MKAVLFDLFGTLTPPVVGAPNHRALAAALGIDFECFREIWKRELPRERNEGRKGSLAADLDSVCRRAGVEPDPGRVREAVRIREAFARETVRPRADAEETLRAFRAAGARIGLVSNCSSEIPAAFAETPLAPLVDAPVFSCRVGASKPDPAIYLEACERLDARPGDAAFVGDGPSGELTAAADLGLRAVLLQAPGEEEIYSAAEREIRRRWSGDRVAALAELPARLLGAGEGIP